MSHIRILVCRVDDEESDHLNELAAFDLPQLGPADLAAATALDALEACTLETGHAALRGRRCRRSGRRSTPDWWTVLADNYVRPNAAGRQLYIGM